MRDYKSFFKNKRVTVVGLGLLGKRLGDIAFLAECGAKVLVTDFKTAKELAPSIAKLKKYSNINTFWESIDWKILKSAILF